MSQILLYQVILGREKSRAHFIEMLYFSDININLLKHIEDLCGRHYGGYAQIRFCLQRSFHQRGKTVHEHMIFQNMVSAIWKMNGLGEE